MVGGILLFTSSKRALQRLWQNSLKPWGEISGGREVGKEGGRVEGKEGGRVEGKKSGRRESHDPNAGKKT